MQTVSSDFTLQSGGNSYGSVYTYGVNIAWTKESNSTYSFFTIGESAIGSSDAIPGAGAFAGFFNQYVYTNYADYVLSWSVQRTLGQYPYGAFGAEADVVLDNRTLLFLPNYDPIIGDYILPGRPINIASGFGTETILMFYGITTMPENDMANKQLKLRAFDGMDYLNNYTSLAQGPAALANDGVYVSVTASDMIQDLLLEAGFLVTQMSLEASTQPPIGYFPPYGKKIGDIIQQLCEAEQAMFFFDENGIATFWNRQHIPLNSQSKYSFSSSDIIQITPQTTPVLNHVIVQAKPREVMEHQFVWQSTTGVGIPAVSSTTAIINLSTNPSFETNTTNWSTAGGAALSRITTDSYSGSACGSLVSNGALQYMTQTIACTVSTSYVAQCHVKGTLGTDVVIDIVENSITIASDFVTLTGGWDLLDLSSFTTDGTHTTFEVRIYPTTPDTVKVDAVMVQLTSGAISTYFDGSLAASTSYIYTWTGTAHNSTSRATPVSSVTIKADISDDDGSLPVTSIDTPIYSNPLNFVAQSNYGINTKSDGSGTEGNSSYITIQSETLNGSEYEITFSSTATLPLYILPLTLWGTPAKVKYSIEQEYKDDASIALYGTNPTNNGDVLTISNDLIQSPDVALSNATVLVNDYNVPFQRFEMSVFSVVELQIGDTITVETDDILNTIATPMGVLLSVTQERELPKYVQAVVVGKTDSSETSDLLQQKLEVEVRLSAVYFTIGLSAIGGAYAIAP